MSDFKKNIKHGVLRNLKYVAAAVVIFAAVAFLVVANIRVHKKKQEFKKQVADLQNEIAELKNRNTDLQEGIEKSDDHQYIEKVARDELDLQKPGEQAVSFVMPENNSIAPTSSNAVFDVQGWFASFWGWVKSIF